MSIIDIKWAYFCASAGPSKPTYVALPYEDHGCAEMCGLLPKHMYRARKAASTWHCKYTCQFVRTLGFEVGDASAYVLFRRGKGQRWRG